MWHPKNGISESISYNIKAYLVGHVLSQFSSMGDKLYAVKTTNTQNETWYEGKHE